MPTAMSAKAIAQTAYNAGWRGEQLVIATAVALAESGGRYWVVNSIGCVGLWQINVPVHKQYTTQGMKDPDANARAAMAIYKGAGSTWKPWEAYTGPDGKGSDGPYLAQMGRARLAAASIKGSTVTASTGTGSSGGGGGSVDQAAYQTISGSDLLGGMDMLPGLLGDLWGPNLLDGESDGMGSGLGGLLTLGKAWLSMATLWVRAATWMANPKNWLRVVEVIGGAAALIVGLKMLADTGIQSPVAGAVNSAVKAGQGAVRTTKKVQSGVKQAAAAAATGGASAAAKGGAIAAKSAKAASAAKAVKGAAA